jgi:hypothetical protein
MTASNENVPTSVDGDASTLGAYATETPPEDDISDEDIDDLPSAAEIVVARIVVTPLSDLLPREVADTPRISFLFPDKCKAPASSVITNNNPFVSRGEDAPSSSTHTAQIVADADDKDCFGNATADVLRLSLLLALEGSNVHTSIKEALDAH